MRKFMTRRQSSHPGWSAAVKEIARGPAAGRSGETTRAPTKKGKSADHTKKQLKECGTCKGKHLCFHWVDDKGPWGRCEGDHPAFKCDNPRKCDEPLKQ